ncbi:MAG: hypothetical protein ACRDJG_08745 [Actinomycetota bacterium]
MPNFPGFFPQEVSYWTVALLVGVVVELVVILLLSFLIKLVMEIDRGVASVVDGITRVAHNTSHTWLIAETAKGVDSVLAEGLNHHLFLTRTLESVGRG